MIRTLSLACVAALMFCGNASGIFIIDNFFRVDTVANDGITRLATPHGGGNIFAEATTTGATIFGATDQQGYFVQAVNPGDTFTLTYTWDVPTFDDLQSVSGNQIAAIPQAFAGAWTLVIDGGAAGVLFNGTALGAPGVPIDIDTTDQLAFTFTWGGFGPGIGQFGGPGSPLIATPEPTAALMLGSVIGLGIARRRRRR
ncbi:MAG: PEP-CTERM sorting domain-containing protein [Planctomycetota bacterium]